MLEDFIIKKQVLTIDECQEIASFFLDKSKVYPTLKGIRGYGPNRRQFLTIDYLNDKTQWFEKVAQYETRIRNIFELEKYQNGHSWISMFVAPCDLPMHVDPAVKNKVRLIALLQKSEEGGEVVISETQYGKQTILPLETGDVYLLPAHRYYHGITLIEEGQIARVAMGFDYQKMES